jgi:hypothetical protein
MPTDAEGKKEEAVMANLKKTHHDNSGEKYYFYTTINQKKLKPCHGINACH